MAKSICGWCGTSTHLTPYGVSLNVDVPDSTPVVQAALRCDQCLRLSIATVSTGQAIAHTDDPRTITNFWAEVDVPDSMAPVFILGQHFAAVPEHIAGAAGEAHRCRSINALMSSVLMARTVVEAVAKEKGVTSGSLFQKIDQLGDLGVIKSFTVETAHVIRTFGNDMAHGDITMPIDAEDADGVLAYMDELLNEVFQNPAKLAKLQARAAARK